LALADSSARDILKVIFMFKYRIDNKGFTLAEMLVTIALVGIISPILLAIFIFGIQDFDSTDKYLDQQNRVNEVIRYIRQDYEECKEVVVGRTNGGDVIWVKFVFPGSFASPAPGATPQPDPKNKVWTFYKGSGALSLYVGDENPVDNFSSMYFDVMVDDLDTSASKFYFSDESLKLYVKPNANNIKYRGRNINKEMITEFSVRNKYREVVEVSSLPTAAPTPALP